MTHEALPGTPLPLADIDLPQSPCVRNCCLDDDDVCLGCGRKLDEILAWHGADTAGRDQILVLAAQRRAARGKRGRWID
ncbi:MAG: DUF1289 domain-containing protein [Arenimonas sp.]